MFYDLLKGDVMFTYLLKGDVMFPYLLKGDVVFPYLLKGNVMFPYLVEGDVSILRLFLELLSEPVVNTLTRVPAEGPQKVGQETAVATKRVY